MKDTVEDATGVPPAIADKPETLGFEARVLGALPVSPWVSGLIGLVVIFGGFLATAVAVDYPLDRNPGTLPFPIGGAFWGAFFTIAGLVYLFVARGVATVANARDWARFAAAIAPGSRAAVAAEWREMSLRLQRWRIRATLMGAAFGVFFYFPSNNFAPVPWRPFPDVSFGLWLVESGWFLVLIVLSFMLVARMLFAVFMEQRTIACRCDSGIEMNLLDLSAVEPLLRIGLRNSFNIIVPATIVSLTTATGYNVEPLVIVLIVMVIVAAIVLITPLRRVGHEIRRQKRETLTRLAHEIGEEARAVRAGAAGEPAQRLPALLAYEARIRDVRETAIDLPTARRFTLYLLIPLGSWVGAAIVERGVDLFIP